LDSHFYLDPQATFAEAAGAIKAADMGLYTGGHLDTIDAVFTARGITPVNTVDFSYAYINIRHTYSGDLDVNLKVGSQATPVCTVDVTNRDIAEASPDLVGFLFLDVDACGDFLPPAGGQPWWLEVRDGFHLDEGTIEDFQIVLSGTQRCLATDTPVLIPDSPDAGADGTPGTGDDPFGPVVYSQVDCTTQNGLPALSVDTDGDTIPDVVDPDDDNDSQGVAGAAGPLFRDVVEFFVGTSQTMACASTPTANDEGDDQWPPDFDDDQRVGLADALKYIRHFNANDGDPGYSRRFDLNMDGGVGLADVLLLIPYFNEGCAS
jgi:subtilisin-like proprotein convertase family protein